MKFFTNGLLLVSATLLSGPLSASEYYEYCANRYDNVNACFASLTETEAWIRAEPAQPTGRRFLEVTGAPVVTGTATNPTISYSYSVKPRPPVEVGESYIYALSKNGNPGLACGCPAGGGGPQCYSQAVNCDSGFCNRCVSNGDDSQIISAIENTFKDDCDLNINALTGWPDPPDSTGPMSSANGVTFGPNVGSFSYGNSLDYAFTSDPRAPYSRTLQVTFRQHYAQGQCFADVSTYNVLVSRNERYSCDTGLTPASGTINAQGVYPASSLISKNEVCRSAQTATIVTRRVAQDSCRYGNPCVPATGAKVETQIDATSGPFVLRRSYNSSLLASGSSLLGPGWHLQWTESITAPAGTSPAYALHIGDEGYVERYDRIGTTTSYRSVNDSGNLLVFVSGSGWSLRTASGRLKRFDSSGHLLSTESFGDPTSRISVSYAASDIVSPGIFVPHGYPDKVVGDSGRSVEFSYGYPNSPADCATSLSPAECAGVRLTSAIFSDGSQVAYEYDIQGNLDRVTYADGAGRIYYYNEPSNICPSSMPDACGSAQAPAGGFPHLLTGIGVYDSTSGPSGAVRFSTFQYDNEERVVSSSHPAGADRVSLSYTADDQVVVTLPEGKQRAITLASIGLFRKETDWLDSAGGTPLHTSRSFYPTGQLNSIVDPNGYETRYDYGSEGVGVTTKSQWDGSSGLRQFDTSWDYDLNVPLREEVSNAAHGSESLKYFTYNTRGQVTARCDIDPADPVAMAYTCSDTAAPPAGAKVRRTVTAYCEQSDVTAGTCPLIGLVKSVDGPRTDVSDITTYAYYQTTDLSHCDTLGGTCHYMGDLWKITNALGQVTTYVSYDQNGRVTRMRDANGTLTDFAYNPRGWLTDRIVRANPTGSQGDNDATTHIDYDVVGNVIKITQPDGAYLSYGYDDAHRLTDITDNAGDHIHYTLDAAGNRKQEDTYDPSSMLKRTLSRQYDQLNHLLKTINASSVAVQNYQNPAEAPPTGITYTNGYDGNGNAVYSVDANGVGTEQQYDPLNRLVKTLQDHAGTGSTHDTSTQYAYDARDNLRSVTDPNGLVTNYTYDGLNNLTDLDSPDTGHTGYTYDVAGNRVTMQDANQAANGTTVNYSYDALNRLTGISYPDSSLNVSYVYDVPTTGCYNNIGRLTRITDSSGSTTYCYDRRGNVSSKTQITGGITFTTGYAYTLADRVSRITYPSGGIVSYGRDTTGRITSVKYRASVGATLQTILSNVSYYPFGPANVMTFGNGRILTKTYDQDYAIDQVASSDPNGLAISASVDPLGNLIHASNAPNTNPPMRSYAYDPLYRLTGVTDATSSVLEGYTYNATGDRLSKTYQGQTDTYDYTSPLVTHQLQDIDGGTRDYDANGNTLDIGSATRLGTTFTFGYDDRNRLVEAAPHSSCLACATVAATYDYNARGERVVRTINSSIPRITEPVITTTDYVYDESGQLLGEYPGTSNVTQAEYIYLNATPIAYVKSGTLYYIETDQLSTPREVVQPGTTTTADVIVWTWDYFGSSFGEDVPTGALTFNLRFPGQYNDAETGLNYNLNRDYEPGTGQYVESDPIGLKGGLVTYNYVMQNPMRLVDSTGQNALSIPWEPGIEWPSILDLCAAVATPIATAVGIAIPNSTAGSCQTERFPPPEDNCSKGPDCKKATPFHLERARGPFAQNGITDAHAYKDEYGATPNKLYDICACKDGSIVIKHVGQCGEPGPLISTHETW